MSTKALFTGYYAKHGKHPQAVSISVVRPRWCPNMLHYTPLAPSWALVELYKRGGINADQYVTEYTRLLDSRGKPAQKMVDELPEGSVLLCYEKPPQFCHRHAAAVWLAARGADVIFRELP